ncbi:hypothetical protein PPYR_06389 [Photinus pyralis]|uniref:F-box domain-containing protein n=1 Tax=Photinus pyralis TaxID=7054 RepID=A0A1Y1LNQ6_PHOPY|nr:uncharacterized protein LOC116167423 [Photinus pyralis]KAB0800649.1 hypothetical protein PPYR_06389 [Photinus pyralis]
MFSGSPLKRKCETSDDDQLQFKRRFIEEPPETTTHILDFSDCVLLEIFKHLDATSLYHLSLTCHRLAGLVDDQSLWISIDGRLRPNSTEKLEFCWRHVTEKTKRLLLAAEARSRCILSRSLVFCPEKLANLTVLSLEHQCIKYCMLIDFPQSLQELSFRHSFITQHTHFFRFSEKSMSNLKTLIMDHCQWFESYNLVSICKYPKLEILSLYMCKRLGSDDIANVTISSRYGFSSLKVLDVRFTGIGDQFADVFSSKASIQIMYFQCHPTTYYSDRYQRQLDLMREGTSADDNSYMSDDDAQDNTPAALKKRFNAGNFQKYETHGVTNNGVISFNKLEPALGSRSRPKSTLYKYPYTRCTCRNKEKDKSKASNEEPEFRELQEKLENEQKKQAHVRENKLSSHVCLFYPNTTYVCSNIVLDSCFIPTWYHREARPDLPLHNWLYAREPKNDYEIAMYENTDKYIQSHITYRCVPRDCMCENSQLHYAHDTPPDFTLVLADRVDRFKNCADVKDEARQFLAFLFECCDVRNDELLQDESFVDEIGSILHELSKKVTYNMRRVFKYHGSCFNLLWNVLKRNTNIDHNLRTFFRNLFLSESGGHCALSDEIFNKAPNVCEVPDSELEKDKTLQSLDTGNSRILLVDLPSAVDRVREVPTRFVTVSRREGPIKKQPSFLKEISFRGSVLITDASLVHLRHLELDLLDVTGTNITREGVQEFMKCNPQCWVIHESVCVCRPSLHF